MRLAAYPRTCLALLMWGSIGIVGCCGGGSLILDDRPLTDYRIARLERELDEQLPNGSDRRDVEAWFAARGINAMPCIHVTDNRVVGLCADVPSCSLFNVREARICIDIYFDQERGVVKKSVRRLGPSF